MIKERGYKATIDLRVSKLDYVRANTNWPNLSRIGRNPISRFVVFAPIVAQILIHEETHTYINDVLNLYHLHWAYWSLIFFSAAQIIYFLKCPSDIKLHPNRYEYIQALNNTSTDEELKNHSFHIIKKHFTKHGGLLDFSENKYEEVTRMLTLEEMRDKRFEASTVTDGEYTSNAIYIFRQSVRVGIPHKSIDWNTIEKSTTLFYKAMRSIICDRCELLYICRNY